ncbi:integrase [Vibrio sp. JCM 19236]|nr:integrase [Vibrio sp. JCM 19236]
MLDSMLEAKDIALNTHKQKSSRVKMLSERLGDIRIKKVTVKEIALILQESIDQGKISQAVSLRTEWSQVFDWAQHHGEVEPGFNPASATKTPRLKQKRSRLSLENAERLLEYVESNSKPHVRNAIHLALATAQRVGDISMMEFGHIKDGHLFIEQQKSQGKTKIAIPLTLKNPLLNKNLGEIIQSCRDNVVSKYIIHYSKRTPRARVGGQVSARIISQEFTQVIKDMAIEYSNENPPTFHELCSVAERSYREAGIDTQALLGHKSAKMTDKYHDNRGEEFIYIGQGK